MKKIIILLFFCMLIPFCIAKQPSVVTSEPANNINIIYPLYDAFPFGKEIKLNFHVFNSSSFILTNDTTDCNFHLYNSTGNHIISNDLLFDVSDGDFFIDLNSTILNKKDLYNYLVYCNNSQEAGEVEVSFFINTHGTNYNENNLTVIALILSPLILSFVLVFGVSFMGDEHIIFKWFIYLLSVVPFFISLQFGIEAIIKFYNWDEMQNAIANSIWIMGSIWVMMIVYFLIYAFKKMIDTAGQKRDEELQY